MASSREDRNNKKRIKKRYRYNTENKRKNRTNKKVNSKRKSKKIRRKIKIILRSIFLLIILLLLIISIYYISKKFFFKKDEKKAYASYYSNIDYDNYYKEYNNSLYYNKYIKQDGKYVKLDKNNYNIKNSIDNTYENLIWEDLSAYFSENDINQDDLSIYIEKDNKTLLSINEHIKYEDYKIENLLDYLLVSKSIDDKILDINSKVKLQRSDILETHSSIYNINMVDKEVKIEKIINDRFLKNDKVSENVLNRIINQRGLNYNSIFNDIDQNINIKSLSVLDVSKLMDKVNKSNNNMKNIFYYTFKEDNSLFTKTIYSISENNNIVINNDNLKIDFGLVNSDTKYIYSIYSKELNEKQINDIGDIINRKINYFESLKKIYK